MTIQQHIDNLEARHDLLISTLEYLKKEEIETRFNRISEQGIWFNPSTYENNLKLVEEISKSIHEELKLESYFLSDDIFLRYKGINSDLEFLFPCIDKENTLSCLGCKIKRVTKTRVETSIICERNL